jgi:hypothetical protein
MAGHPARAGAVECLRAVSGAYVFALTGDDGRDVATRRAHDGDIVLEAETSVSAARQRAGRDLGGDISPGRIGSCVQRATKATGPTDATEQRLEEEGAWRVGFGLLDRRHNLAGATGRSDAVRLSQTQVLRGEERRGNAHLVPGSFGYRVDVRCETRRTPGSAVGCNKPTASGCENRRGGEKPRGRLAETSSEVAEQSTRFVCRRRGAEPQERRPVELKTAHGHRSGSRDRPTHLGE